MNTLHALLISGLLLAQRRINKEPEEETLAGALEADGPLDFTLLILVFAGGALALGIWAICNWYSKRREDPTCNDPVRLFKDLCHGQELSRSETKLLRRAAVFLKVPSSADLFIEPRHLANLLNEAGWARDHSLIRGLQEKLFVSGSGKT